MEIRKKLEPSTALKAIEEAKEKIVGQNILELLESEDVKKEIDEIKPGKYLHAAFVSGIVHFDDEKNCLVQHLIKPIKSGEQMCDKLEYEKNLTFGLLREENTSNEIAAAINILTRLTGRTKQVIGELHGQDLAITQDIAGFFFTR